MHKRHHRPLPLLLVALTLGVGLATPGAAHAEPPACIEAGAEPGPETTINVNTASAAQLEQLPRIGPKKALAIVEARARLGGFKRPSQLLRVKGIGRATLRQLLPRIRLRDAPPEAPGQGEDGPSEGAAGADPLP